jgi:hypothetical protein
MRCQLTDLRNMAQAGSLMRRLSNVRVRVLRKLIKPGVRLLRQALADDKTKPDYNLSGVNESRIIRPGDFVRVRAREEIRKLLDGEGRTNGCSFMPEMYKFCGQKFRVLKTVELFFDEPRQKMCRSRNSVILEGAVCSGRKRLYTVKCDRNCFFFWQIDWLNKVE